MGSEMCIRDSYGRGYHEKNGDLHMLKPFEKEKNELVFTVLDGDEEIQAAVEEFDKQLNQ